MSRILVWRCKESKQIVRALKNLRDLEKKIRDDEKKEEYEQVGNIQTVVKEGTANAK